MHHRLAGSHRDAPKRHLDAFVAQRLLNQIVVADGRAASRDQHIGAGVAGCANARHRGLQRVGRNTKINRVRALGAHQRVQRVTVGINDLPRRKRLARHHQLVACREQCDFGAAVNGQLRMVHARRER